MRERKLNRWKDYDYSQHGFYFVTICTGNRINYFGEIAGKLNQPGEVAEKFWREIPAHYSNVYLDEFVIMPNHIHGIIIIGGDSNVGTEYVVVGTEQCSVPTETKTTRPKNYGLLSKIVKSYKNAVTKEIKKQGNDYPFQWQRSFYDHIIRSEDALDRIRSYIVDNPIKWESDKNNPQNLFM